MRIACQGCRDGLELRGELHVDSSGRHFMVCQNAQQRKRIAAGLPDDGGQAAYIDQLERQVLDRHRAASQFVLERSRLLGQITKLEARTKDLEQALADAIYIINDQRDQQKGLQMDWELFEQIRSVFHGRVVI